jgi:hypothetical protein
MAARSPWTLTALALAWLGCASVLAAKPLDVALLWLLGLGAGAYLARPVSGGGDALASAPSAPPTEVCSGQPQDPSPPAGAAPAELKAGATSAAERSAASSPPLSRTAEPTRPSPLAPWVPLRTLTAEEVAAVLRLELADVIAAMATGQLPGNQVAGHWRCNETSLTTWLDGAWFPNRGPSTPENVPPPSEGA